MSWHREAPEVDGGGLFSQQHLLERLRKVVEDVGDTIAPDEARASWIASGFDTEDNLRHAIDTLGEEYRSPPERAQVEAKVLALHFIALSKWATASDCLSLLERCASMHESAPSTPVQSALLWDILGVAKVCAQLDLGATEQYYGGMPQDVVARQVELGLNAVREGEGH